MYHRVWKASTRTRSRYFLRFFTILTCGIFVFVFYFVNGIQRVDEPLLQLQPVEYSRPRCVWPIYWAGQSSKYTVLYNYVPADNLFGYNESITYTTHGTTKFLNHIENIAKRWNGPVSLAAYAPSTDFEDTLAVIQYLRQCSAPAIRQFTTFHLFFDTKYKPSISIPCSLDDYVPTVDCDNFVYPNTSFQSLNNLSYPVNVARNIARISAQTLYILPSDIELYPSVNLIPMFLDMIAQQRGGSAVRNATTNGTTSAVLVAANSTTVKPNASAVNDNATRNESTAASPKTLSKKKTRAAEAPTPSSSSCRTVYVLPLFEVDKSLQAPENKSELVALFKTQKVVPFHKFVCPECHRVPKQDDWLKYVPDNNTLSVIYSTKRHKPYQNWEPIYIGTNEEPLYDERLNWEGMSDKMTQAYEMCLLDYNFSILDNAFLVHAPGIKRYSKNLNSWRKEYVTENSKLRKQIKKELVSKHTPNNKCSL